MTIEKVPPTLPFVPYYDADGIVIFHGNCLELMKNIPEGSVDMTMCDPPYGTTNCRWDTVIDLPLMWEQLNRVTKKRRAIVMTASQPFTSVLVTSNIKNFKTAWVWDKVSQPTGHLNAKKYPLKIHEDIIQFSNGSPFYNPVMESGEPYNVTRVTFNGANVYGKESINCLKSISNGERYPRTIQSIPRSRKERGLHPTQKPVALMQYLIKTYTNPGETVLDFAMGSGTTLVAARLEGRKAIGIEISEEYCEVAVKRLIDMSVKPTKSNDNN